MSDYSRQGINKLESRTGRQRDFHWSLCWENGFWGQRLREIAGDLKNHFRKPNLRLVRLSGEHSLLHNLPDNFHVSACWPKRHISKVCLGPRGAWCFSRNSSSFLPVQVNQAVCLQDTVLCAFTFLCRCLHTGNTWSQPQFLNSNVCFWFHCSLEFLI